MDQPLLLGTLELIPEQLDPRLNELCEHRSHLLRSVECFAKKETRTIRVPANVITRIDRLSRMRGELAQTLCREPDFEELAGKARVSMNELHDELRISHDAIPLETPLGPNGGCLGDLIEDTQTIDPAEAAITARRAELLRAELTTLPPRQARVLRLRFGVDENKERTLKEVGRELGGVTKERIRQLEARALERLRKPHRARRLRKILDG